MSYDLQIWSRKQPDLTELLTKHGFVRTDQDFYYETKEWQIAQSGFSGQAIRF